MTRKFAAWRWWYLFLHIGSGQFLLFCLRLIFGHLNIALFSHAIFRCRISRFILLVVLLRLAKTKRAICFKLLGESRVSASPLSVQAKPNHLGSRWEEFGSAAS